MRQIEQCRHCCNTPSVLILCNNLHEESGASQGAIAEGQHSKTCSQNSMGPLLALICACTAHMHRHFIALRPRVGCPSSHYCILRRWPLSDADSAYRRTTMQHWVSGWGCNTMRMRTFTPRLCRRCLSVSLNTGSYASTGPISPGSCSATKSAKANWYLIYNTRHLWLGSCTDGSQSIPQHSRGLPKSGNACTIDISRFLAQGHDYSYHQMAASGMRP